MVYSTRRFVLCLTLCHFVIVFFSPFSTAITSLGEERANLGAFRTFVRFVLVWICRFPLPLGIWEGLWFMIVAIPGLFSYLFIPPKISQELLNIGAWNFVHMTSMTICIVGKENRGCGARSLIVISLCCSGYRHGHGRGISEHMLTSWSSF